MAQSPRQSSTRRGFDEVMAMSRLPAQGSTHRFASLWPSWVPGEDILKAARAEKTFSKRSFGGHVFIQAPLAATRVVQEQDESSKLGIHSIQGVFTLGGLPDRPFIYEVQHLASTRSSTTQLTTARQPTQPSSRPSGPYPPSDADKPLAGVAFACITTFRRPMPSYADVQPPSVQHRFADILRLKLPHEWDAVPQIDVDRIKELLSAHGTPGPFGPYGTFPILDMHKVDMTAYNAARPLPERTELILYRLHKPLAADANSHVLCHAFGADRNGLLMLGNHLGWGHDMGPVATVSYSFYVHTNVDEAVLTVDDWWILETSWPRVSVGRGMMETKVWSPRGRHVATGYQDGICLPQAREKL